MTKLYQNHVILRCVIKRLHYIKDPMYSKFSLPKAQNIQRFSMSDAKYFILYL